MEDVCKKIYPYTSFFTEWQKFIRELHFSRIAIIQINKRKGKSRGSHLS
jgi:hypothetical protein